MHGAGVRRLVRLALDEDLGRGDATTEATVAAAARAAARIVARRPLVLAGLPLVPVIVEQAARPSIEVEPKRADGAAVESGTVLLELRGAAADLLALERVILNFLQRLCGVATLTRRYVEAVAGTRARIVDTRKTVPGWRLLDKYAVAVGGGTNHRFGLDDGILVKDNHIVACGGIRPAVERARAGAHHLLKIEVECETLAEVDEALGVGAEVILLDNMSPAELAAAVARIAGRALVEASGGITLATVREVAETGVDLISVGALTHSAPAADLAMDLALDDGARTGGRRGRR
ncbi:MAG: carboxylating nicotinate-nucleotide diphosphorylase [Deltaproteobacteria bacterium]|nr:carboxylating nicotinate-nucleotide diphosphorylase [Deltaproteobacteria bacterium]